MEPNMKEISTVMSETRVFAPPPDFSARAHLRSMDDYRKLCAEAEADPDAFWGRRAREELEWKTPFGKVLDHKPPHARWFEGGKTNLAHNCLDRHLKTRGDKVAIRFEGEPKDQREITYRQLHAQVCLLANGLLS